jgi:hypothetical protein
MLTVAIIICNQTECCLSAHIGLESKNTTRGGIRFGGSNQNGLKQPGADPTKHDFSILTHIYKYL